MLALPNQKSDSVSQNHPEQQWTPEMVPLGQKELLRVEPMLLCASWLPKGPVYLFTHSSL